MDLESLQRLPPDALQQLLPSFLSGFVSQDTESIRAMLQQLVSDWTDAGRADVHSALVQSVGAGDVQWAVKECQAVSRVWSRFVITESSIRGLEHLEGATHEGPTVILASHLSYFDASATDAIIAEATAAIANRLVFAAGPKVYQSLFRRVAAAGLNTLPVPQSNRLSHIENIPPREFAHLVRAGLKSSRQLMEQGNILLVYPEGSRSRTGRLGPFISGVHRYLDLEGLSIVPMGITGTQAIMPVGARSIRPGAVSLAFGEPIRLTDSLSPRDALAECHRRVARLLPPTHSPPPGQPALT